MVANVTPSTCLLSKTCGHQPFGSKGKSKEDCSGTRLITSSIANNQQNMLSLKSCKEKNIFSQAWGRRHTTMTFEDPIPPLELALQASTFRKPLAITFTVLLGKLKLSEFFRCYFFQLHSGGQGMQGQMFNLTPVNQVNNRLDRLCIYIYI